MKVEDLPGRPCFICHEVIPPTNACITHGSTGEVMCCSHEGEKIWVWELTHEGAFCIYRKKAEAAEDIASFKENGDKYTFRRVKWKCADLLGTGEFVGW